jgi:hypothetical protein
MFPENSLRRLKPEPNVLYSIEVRGRPVQVVLVGQVATHTYLVLLNQANEVCDSLSFDPSCSNGWNDSTPNDVSRGFQRVQTNCTYEVWKKLKEAYKVFANKHTYDLLSHNCCHAVMGGLSGSSCTYAMEGISFARVANNTFFDLTGTLSSKQFNKKNA